MQIPRQLYNEGGISSVPLRRENFGLGSWVKEKVRKIIPKEVAQVAVKAAPFVAPFNPAIAGAMSGLGTFQQTGRMGKSLTAGALNYGGGQAARYLGGAGFQGNPFAGGTGAFTPSGFMGGFSSPFGTETGLGKFLQDRRVARQGINIDKGRGSTLGQTYRQPGQPMGNQFANARQAMTGDLAYSPPTPLVDAADAGTYFPRSVENVAAMENVNIRPYQDRIMRTASGVEPRPDLKAIENVIRGGGGQDVMPADAFTKAATEGITKTSQEGLGSRIVEKVKSLNPLSGDFDFAKAGDTIKDLGGKALNAVFRDKDGNLDKTAILAALVTVPTFFEARALADEAGIGADEFTEEMFTAAKADSKQTYESNLGSFFTGTGYTGNLAKGGLIRRNYTFGSDPDEYPETGDDITIFELIKEQGIPVGEQVKGKIKQGAKSILMAEGTGLSPEQEAMIDGMLQKGADTDTISSITGASPDQIKIYIQTQKKKLSKGGRIGYRSGTPNFGEDRYISEMMEDYGGMLGEGKNLLDDIEKDALLKRGEFMDPKDLKAAKKRFERLENKFEDVEARYQKEIPDENIINLPYYQQKSEELDKREQALDERFEKLGMMKLDTSGIAKSTGFQNWLKLYEANDPRADAHPYSDEYEDILWQNSGQGDTSYMERKMDRDYKNLAKGGRVKYALGTPPAGEGGLGGLPVEADMRYTGGFMPYGEKEKADDVPARLSKNEFVFTADAVRAAGGGSMQKGAQRMYNTMKMLEGQLR